MLVVNVWGHDIGRPDGGMSDKVLRQLLRGGGEAREFLVAMRDFDDTDDTERAAIHSVVPFLHHKLHSAMMPAGAEPPKRQESLEEGAVHTLPAANGVEHRWVDAPT